MLRALLLTAVVAGSACSQIAGLDDVHAGSTASPDAAGGGTDATDASACTGVTQSPADEGSAHSADLATLAWNANPPASGTHYPGWAKWDRTYTTEMRRGYWVHNLEHAGIVLLYNCTNCQADVDRLIAIRTSASQDPRCAAPVKTRIIVTPDSMLPAGVKFAATAWDFSYTASCMNEQEIRAFAAQHYGDLGVAGEKTNCDPGQVE